jgi:hypothetical protein
VDIQLKTAYQELPDMEYELSTDDIRIPQLLLEVKVLEKQLYNKKLRGLMKINKTTREQVTQLENQMQSLEMRYVSHFISFFIFLFIFLSSSFFCSFCVL